MIKSDETVKKMTKRQQCQWKVITMTPNQNEFVVNKLPHMYSNSDPQSKFCVAIHKMKIGFKFQIDFKFTEKLDQPFKKISL